MAMTQSRSRLKPLAPAASTKVITMNGISLAAKQSERRPLKKAGTITGVYQVQGTNIPALVGRSNPTRATEETKNGSVSARVSDIMRCVPLFILSGSFIVCVRECLLDCATTRLEPGSCRRQEEQQGPSRARKPHSASLLQEPASPSLIIALKRVTVQQHSFQTKL